MKNNDAGVTIDTTNFTSLQTERYNAIYHIYGADAALFIPFIKPRGENSWKRFYEKAIEVNKAHGDLGEYYLTLTAAYGQHSLITVSQIQQIACEVRADMGLAPYFKQIKVHALSDFSKLFLYEEEFEESEEPGGTGPLIGLRLLKAIKAD